MIFTLHLLIISLFFFLKLIIFIVSPLKDSRFFEVAFTSVYIMHHFLCFQMTILQILKNLIEFLHLLLLWMSFQDYFYINESFLLNTQYLLIKTYIFHELFFLKHDNFKIIRVGNMSIYLC